MPSATPCFEPLGQLLKGQHRVHDALVAVGLVLFGQARPDEHGPGIRVTAFDVETMRLHGGSNVGKIWQQIRVVFLDEQVDAVAAGRDQNIPLTVAQQLLVGGLDMRRADGSLLCAGEAQRFQPGFKRAVVICDKGRRDGGVYGRVPCEQHLDLLNAARDLLGVLRADDKTLAAENAFVAHDVRLACRKPDGLDRTGANAAVAVFAIGALEL